MAGLVPAIHAFVLAAHKDVDARDIGERSDAVLRTAMPGHDGSSSARHEGVIAGSRHHLLPAASWVDTVAKVFLRLPPSALSELIMTREMRAVIRPYSIAVAPLSSFMKRLRDMRRSRFQPNFTKFDQ